VGQGVLCQFSGRMQAELLHQLVFMILDCLLRQPQRRSNFFESQSFGDQLQDFSLTPSHPILAGVTTFNGGSSAYRANATVRCRVSRLISRYSVGYETVTCPVRRMAGAAAE